MVRGRVGAALLRERGLREEDEERTRISGSRRTGSPSSS